MAPELTLRGPAKTRYEFAHYVEPRSDELEIP